MGYISSKDIEALEFSEESGKCVLIIMGIMSVTFLSYVIYSCFS